ncbi:MAG: hypothetical protein KDC11_03665 [Chitinophagaceae bacterium]|nr:hypothetical protein [Chitinophagaceae bacterium]
MNLKKYLLLPLLLFSIISNAQELDHESANASRIGRVAVKADIANIINFSEALFPVAIEYRFIKWVSVSGEIGIPLFFNTLAYSATQKTKKNLHSDIRYGAELRLYFPPGEEIATYFAVSGTLRLQDYSLRNGHYFSRTGYKHTYDYADIKKTVRMINTLMGMQTNISHRVFVEVQFGIGYKEVLLNRSNIINDVNTYEEFKFNWGLPIGEAEDRVYEKGSVIAFPLALKFCLVL